jgi:cardiolipin synthase
MIKTANPPGNDDRAARSSAQALADQAFSRAAGVPLVAGNSVRLLKDGRENYPAWLEAIRLAERTVHFENYYIRGDAVGDEFAAVLLAKAQEGVRVRLLYDWLGGLGKAPRKFWKQLRAGGVEVRCYNPPRLDSPLGWVNRDHRKMLAVDGRVGFVAGLCVGREWVGRPERGIPPWRDTGVEVRGPAVADIERAFEQTWGMAGGRIPEGDVLTSDEIVPTGNCTIRVLASVPNTASLYRLDQLVAAFARERLWLTDAYYSGTTSYVQALRAAAKAGVDVRLLVPGATDVPIMKLLSRSGYRPLLEAGVRIFEWNGSMVHAKTAVADGRWSRVGSTNLNVTGWLGNCELDVVVKSEDFARAMEEMYLDDLTNSTEVILGEKRRILAPGAPRHPLTKRGAGSASRAAVGVVRIGKAVGAGVMNRRVLDPVEARLMVVAGLLLLTFAVLVALLPALLAYPSAAVAAWFAFALLVRAWKLHGNKERESSPSHRRSPSTATEDAPTGGRK